MRLKLLASVVLLGWVCNSYADPIDDVVKLEMQHRRIPGLSLAVVDGGKIVKVATYGEIELGSGIPVTPTTLFQAGSISKAVSALAALHLVEQGKLALDDDVNLRLQSWKVPENEFTAHKKITLRGILSHTAGLNVHGFPGYAVTAPMPTLIQVLNGEKPANTDPIRVQAEPGSKWDYSGGGYTIMQQMMIDVTGQSYPAIMQSLVLAPLGMDESTYQQPLPNGLVPLTASGHLSFREKVPGHWHIYPEMAAAGLWSTPSDLARYVIGVQRSIAGQANPVISQAMTAQMLTVQKGNDGLGVFLLDPEPAPTFGHNGRDEGFDAYMIGTVRSGQGLIVMINANDDSQMMQRIQNVVANVYHWPGEHGKPPVGALKKFDATTLSQLTGHYDFNGHVFSFEALNGHLVIMSGGMPDSEFAALDSTHFISTDGQLKLNMVRDNKGQVGELELIDHENVMKMKRFGGPIHKLTMQHEPTHIADAVRGLIKAGGDGASIPTSPMLTDGLKQTMSANADPALANLGNIRFIATMPVQNSAVVRFGSEVVSLACYRVANPSFSKYLIVYLTADLQIADYDLVAD